MKHLEEMCCAQCREKIEQILARSLQAPTPTTLAEAWDDRRELLMMVEALLANVAVKREYLRRAQALMIDAFHAHIDAQPPPPPQVQ